MTLKEQAAAMKQEEIVALLSRHRKLETKYHLSLQNITALTDKNQELSREVTWWKRQHFGQKSERRLITSDNKNQLMLGELLESPELPPADKVTVKSFERTYRKKEVEFVSEDSKLKFDASVPVKVIEVPNFELTGLKAEEYEVIDEKVTYRLAQKPSSYVVLKFIRKVVKIKSTKKIICAPAPCSVIEKSVADVSFLSGLLIDKFLYHLPLYRQHQRLEANGIYINRATLTNLVHRVAQLLEPIYHSQLSSILQSKVLAMDETPIKAGRKKGAMQQGYFWPIYGDNGEIVFLFAMSRGAKVVHEALSGFQGTLLSDGYRVYDSFAKSVQNVTHAQCWDHTRRKFFEARDSEPGLCDKALDLIAKMYKIEDLARDDEERRFKLRSLESREVVDEFFIWLDNTFQEKILLPSNPFTKAANYALQREKALRVFLSDPNVAIDTNHVERALRPILMGRKNWLFCSSELGARYVAIIQSLIQTYRINDVDPYTYFVDVLQRIDSHPVFDVHLLTPRLWKDNFIDKPFRSHLDSFDKDAAQ